MIMTYQGSSSPGALSPMENNMLNVGGYLSPPLPSYQYQQPYNNYGMNYSSLGGMGSYYNQNPYGYYNPYEQKMQYEKMQEEYETRSNIQRECDLAMIRMGLTSQLKRVPTEKEVIDRYNLLTGNIPKETVDYEKLEQAQLLESYQRTIHTQQPEVFNREEQGYIAAYNDLVSTYKDCTNLYEYCEKANEEMYKDYERKAKEERWNLSNSYNSNDFSSLLDIHNSGNIFSYTDAFGNRKETDISDQLITLPPSIASEYENRKARFLQEIMNGGNR